MFSDYLRTVFFGLLLSLVAGQCLGAEFSVELEEVGDSQYRLTVLERSTVSVRSYRLSLGDKAFLYSEESERLECPNETFSVVHVHGFQGEPGEYDRTEHFLVFGQKGELEVFFAIPHSAVNESGFVSEGGQVRPEMCSQVTSANEYHLPFPEQEAPDTSLEVNLMQVEGRDYLLFFVGRGSPKVLVQADGGAELSLMKSHSFECAGEQFVAVPLLLNLPAQDGARFYRYFMFRDIGGELVTEGMVTVSNKVSCQELCDRSDALEPVTSF